MYKIRVSGISYVNLLADVCFAEVCNQVTYRWDKIEIMKSGVTLIYVEGLRN